MPLNNLIAFLKGKPFQYRLNLKNERLQNSWSSWLIQPSESYLETEKDGPVAISTIEWIAIDAVEIKSTGKLTPPKTIDHTSIVINFLKSESIDFVEIENRLRILL